MSAPVKKAAAPAEVAADVVIDLVTESLNLATVGASWANDRIGPMIQAIVELGAYASEKPHLVAERLALICRIAKETVILVDDMAHCFEVEERDFKAKLAALEGGAP